MTDEIANASESTKVPIWLKIDYIPINFVYQIEKAKTWAHASWILSDMAEKDEKESGGKYISDCRKDARQYAMWATQILDQLALQLRTGKTK